MKLSLTNFQLRELLDKFDALRAREKVLLLTTALVFLLLLWDAMVNTPLSKAVKLAKERRATLQTEVDGFDVALKTLETEMQRLGDPVQAAKKDIEKAETQIKKMDDEVRALSAAGVVAPPEMAQALAKVLSLNRNMQLISLQNLKTDPVLFGQEQTRVASGTPIEGAEADAGLVPLQSGGLTQFYQHKIELRFKGSYLDTLAYVQALEKLQWKPIWNELDIQTTAYPLAEVRLVISTLSLQPGVLGV